MLNLEPSASPEDVRNGYLSMSKVHHPDKSSSSTSAAEFRRVNEAYTILSDPTLRDFYDKHGYEAAMLAKGENSNIPLASSTELISQDNRLKILEARVRNLVRASDELNAHRFLQPSGSISIGTRLLSYSPIYHSWSHSSTSFGVALLTGKGNYSLSLFSSSHIQRGGPGITRASVVLGVALTPTITSRAVVHLMGGRYPALELMVQKSFTDETTLRQSLSVDNGLIVATEWIQQLGKVLIGTLGVTVGASRGVSMEIAKKNGGQFAPNWRGKLRLGLLSNGDLSLGGKAKFSPVSGLELHVGPNFHITSGRLAFELAFQKELEPVVEEQQGAFPTFLTWSIGLEYPDELTLALKITRGGFSFNFPLELPVVESRWTLIGVLAVWTFAPVVAKTITNSLSTAGKFEAVQDKRP